MAEITLGNRIHHIRESMNLTLEEFGKKFTPPANKTIVWRWENDKARPRKKRLAKIAELGGVSVDYLLTGQVNQKLADYTANLELFAPDKVDELGDRQALQDDDFDLGLSAMLHDKVISERADKAMNYLFTEHRAKYKKFDLSSKELLLNVVTLIRKFRTRDWDGMSNPYSYYLAVVLEQIVNYLNNPTKKNEEKINKAMQRFLMTFDEHHFFDK